MLNVINTDFFTMRKYTVPLNQKSSDGDRFITLVNLYTDPKMAEFSKYEKKAFFSFVFKSKTNPSDLSESEIYEMMKESEVNKLSMYTDERYEEIKEMFPSDIRYPTMIFEKTDEYKANNICVLAIPVKGIVPVIKKSDNYKLYNGSLVICRLFKYQLNPDKPAEYYNKLIYIVVDVTTSFSFSEYRTTKDDNFYGCMMNYAVSLVPRNNDVELVLKHESILVPYKDREEFFAPTQKQPNIFKLSDIPSDIFISHNYIMKEMVSGSAK